MIPPRYDRERAKRAACATRRVSSVSAHTSERARARCYEKSREDRRGEKGKYNILSRQRVPRDALVPGER